LQMIKLLSQVNVQSLGERNIYLAVQANKFQITAA